MVPVRVRGKKYRQKPTKASLPAENRPGSPQAVKGLNKRAVSSTLLSSLAQKQARMELTSSISETSFASSPLERLPTEILEMVFMYSLNLSLPRSSPLLGKRLASNHLKTRLYLLLFPSENSQLRNIEYLFSILGTEDAIGNLQSELLAIKWATPAFVRSLTELFVTTTIVREFKRHSLGWLKKSHDAGRGVSKASYVSAHSGTARNDFLDMAREPNLDGVHSFYKRTLNGGRIKEGVLTNFQEWQWKVKNTNIRVDLYVGFCEGRIILNTYDTNPSCDIGLVYNRPIDVEWRLLYCLPTCRIPTKLLHGPWSDEACEELERICRGGGRIDRTGSTMDEEIADEGLHDAIREKNWRAIAALVGSISMYSVSREIMSEPCNICSFGSQVPCHIHMHLYCVGLTVRTDHLKLALTTDCSHLILYSLLNAMKISIDWTDSEITAWAVQKKKDNDERGQWLLDRINSLNESKYEDEAKKSTQAARRRLEENTSKANKSSESDEND